jgi:hypothetical protein
LEAFIFMLNRGEHGVGAVRELSAVTDHATSLSGAAATEVSKGNLEGYGYGDVARRRATKLDWAKGVSTKRGAWRPSRQVPARAKQAE